jgi:ppGpp synthetase/RelA/SpoT-type nucleotidyltranferase
MRNSLHDSGVAFLAECQLSLERALDVEQLQHASVQGRVKTPEAIDRKRARSGALRTNDFIGLRVIVDHCGLLDWAATAVRDWAPAAKLTAISEDDHFAHPGAGGYRALHFDYALVDPAAAGLTADVGVEIQITSALQAAIARVSHDILYRQQRSKSGRVARDVKEIADAAWRIDERIAALAKSSAASR